MVDGPALALMLAAIHLFLRACDEDDFKRAVVAGLLAGLSIETKSTGLVAPVVMVLGGVLFRRWRLIPGVILTGGQVFVCWELLMAMQYDRSHFFLHASGQTLAADDLSLVDKVSKLLADKQVFAPVLFTLVGSVSPALIVLASAALGLGRRWLVLVGSLALSGILAVALCDATSGGGVQTGVAVLVGQVGVR